LREHDDLSVISAGSIEICRVKMNLEVVREGETLLLSVDGKLDTCGSVSLAHSSYMQGIARVGIIG
jgi:hypothetical protein